jgi:SnoaL-like domain
MRFPRLPSTVLELVRDLWTERSRQGCSSVCRRWRSLGNALSCRTSESRRIARLLRHGVQGTPQSEGDIRRAIDRVYGQTAVNTGYCTFSYVRDGKTETLPARYSFTFVKEGKNWMIVDHHSSAMPRLGRADMRVKGYPSAFALRRTAFAI